MRDGYDTAQICKNGHIITPGASFDEFRATFCTKCGASTIMRCEHCKHKIRGWLITPDVAGALAYQLPAYCHNCGCAYPWTELRLAAAKELAGALGSISLPEREQLQRDLDDLVTDNPRTPIAQGRWKKALSKASKETVDALRQVLVDLVSETVRKGLFGP